VKFNVIWATVIFIHDMNICVWGCAIGAARCNREKDEKCLHSFDRETHKGETAWETYKYMGA
jgi:hypothetical protein